MLLLKNHILTELLIRHDHERPLHAGPQVVLSSLRENYWIFSYRGTVWKNLRTCVCCFKVKPVSATPVTGNLPKDRLTFVRAFCVVD